MNHYSLHLHMGEGMVALKPYHPISKSQWVLIIWIIIHSEDFHSRGNWTLYWWSNEIYDCLPLSLGEYDTPSYQFEEGVHLIILLHLCTYYCCPRKQWYLSYLMVDTLLHNHSLYATNIMSKMTMVNIYNTLVVWNNYMSPSWLTSKVAMSKLWCKKLAL